MINLSKVFIGTVSSLLLLSPTNGSLYEASNNIIDKSEGEPQGAASDYPFLRKHRSLLKEKKRYSQTVNDCDRLMVEGDEEDVRRELSFVRNSNSVHRALTEGSIYGGGEGVGVPDVVGKKGSGNGDNTNGAGYYESSSYGTGYGKKGSGDESQSAGGDDDDNGTTERPPTGDDDDDGLDSALPQVTGSVGCDILWRSSCSLLSYLRCRTVYRVMTMAMATLFVTKL
jgi:hypothetical protein